MKRVDDSTLAPGGGIETYSRIYGGLNNQTILPGTGWMRLTAIKLPAKFKVTSISFMSATTPAGTPTNQWFALYDSSLALLGVTADDTTTAWAATTVKTLTLASPVEVPTSGVYYVGVMVAATTVPTFMGVAITSSATNIVPKLTGNSNAGLTTPATAPNPAGAFSGGSNIPWASVQ